MEIRTLSRECDDIFRRITQSQNGPVFIVVEPLRQLFRLWTINLSVYADSRLSLDSSLAYSDSLRDNLLDLLQIMRKSLLLGKPSLVSDHSFTTHLVNS
jgi:hypothetical protein